MYGTSYINYIPLTGDNDHQDSKYLANGLKKAVKCYTNLTDTFVFSLINKLRQEKFGDFFTYEIYESEEDLRRSNNINKNTAAYIKYGNKFYGITQKTQKLITGLKMDITNSKEKPIEECKDQELCKMARAYSLYLKINELKQKLDNMNSFKTNCISNNSIGKCFSEFLGSVKDVFDNTITIPNILSLPIWGAKQGASVIFGIVLNKVSKSDIKKYCKHFYNENEFQKEGVHLIGQKRHFVKVADMYIEVNDEFVKKYKEQFIDNKSNKVVVDFDNIQPKNKEEKKVYCSLLCDALGMLIENRVKVLKEELKKTNEEYWKTIDKFDFSAKNIKEKVKNLLSFIGERAISGIMNGAEKISIPYNKMYNYNDISTCGAAYGYGSNLIGDNCKIF